MKKREKIILGVALAAVLCGLIDFFILSGKNNTARKNQLIADRMNKEKIFAEQSGVEISQIEMVREQVNGDMLISKIESEWAHDPFVQPVQADEEVELPVSDIIYSGYIRAGGNLFAVINGIEYQSGELIKKYEYKLINITPRKIILQKNLKQGTVYLKED